MDRTRRLSAIAVLLLATEVVVATPASAGAGQVPLDTASVERYLACAPRLVAVARGLDWAGQGSRGSEESRGLVARLHRHQADPKSRATIAKALSSCGVATLEAFATLSYSIDLALLSDDRPVRAVPEAADDPLLASIAASIPGGSRLAPLPGNAEVVKPYAARLRALEERTR
jgi:hypothetical protein